jgi:hypothetical protein
MLTAEMSAESIVGTCRDPIAAQLDHLTAAVDGERGP